MHHMENIHNLARLDLSVQPLPAIIEKKASQETDSISKLMRKRERTHSSSNASSPSDRDVGLQGYHRKKRSQEVRVFKNTEHYKPVAASNSLLASKEESSLQML